MMRKANYGTMTFHEYQEFSRNLRARAESLSQRLREQARDIGERELGSGRDMAFMAAHNWQGQRWMSVAQNRAARLILWLQEKSFQPGRMADRILSRAWAQVSA
jgi:hypothetical protein